MGMPSKNDRVDKADKVDKADNTDAADDDDIPAMVMEITDVLDLHTFAPREVGDLVVGYIDECVERGFASVRIIHGKGTGTLRRRVHAVLKRHPRVAEFALADHGSGSWGATVVALKV